MFMEMTRILEILQKKEQKQQHIDGDKPGKTSHAVKDAPHAALLARHAGQLSVGAVEDVGQTEHEDGHDVEYQAVHAGIMVTGAAEEHGTTGSDDH